MIKIFVDDMRVPLEDDWVLASTVKQAQELIEKADEFILSLDHDLGEYQGEEVTTRQLLQWCILEGYTPEAACVHSSNPVGAAWLRQALHYDFPYPIPTVSTPKWGI